MLIVPLAGFHGQLVSEGVLELSCDNGRNITKAELTFQEIPKRSSRNAAEEIKAEKRNEKRLPNQ